MSGLIPQQCYVDKHASMAARNKGTKPFSYYTETKNGQKSFRLCQTRICCNEAIEAIEAIESLPLPHFLTWPFALCRNEHCEGILPLSANERSHE